MAKKRIVIKKTNKSLPKRTLKTITINMGARIYALVKSVNKRLNTLIRREKKNRKHLKKISSLNREVKELKNRIINKKK